MDSKTNFQQTMLKISEVYSKELTPVFISVYWDTLSGFKPEHLTKALNQHMASPQDGKWCPKPAHLICHMSLMIDQDKRNTAYIAQRNQLPHKPPSAEDKARISAMLKELKHEL